MATISAPSNPTFSRSASSRCAVEASQLTPCTCSGYTCDDGAARFVYEYLESNGFPGELFPVKQVLHCTADKSGEFSIELRSDMEKEVVVPGFSGSLKFSSEIRGHIVKGKIKKLKGVSISTLGVVLPLDAVQAGSMCKSKVFFYVGLAFSGIPITALRTLWD